MSLPPTSQEQLWERRAKFGLVGQRSRGMRDLNAAFRAGGYANKALLPLPGTAPVDKSESDYSLENVAGQRDPLAQEVPRSMQPTDAAPSNGDPNTSPKPDAVLHEQCYHDSCNSHVFNDKHAFKEGPTWRMAQSPLYKEDYVPNPISLSAEIRAITEADAALGDIPSDGWQVAIKYAQYAYDSAGHPEWKRKLNHSQSDSALTRVVSGLQRGIYSAKRRSSVVVAGMRSRAGSISSVGSRQGGEVYTDQPL